MTEETTAPAEDTRTREQLLADFEQQGRKIYLLKNSPILVEAPTLYWWLKKCAQGITEMKAFLPDGGREGAETLQKELTIILNRIPAREQSEYDTIQARLTKELAGGS